MHLINFLDLFLAMIAVLAMPVLSFWNGRKFERQPDRSLVPHYWRMILRGWIVVALILLDWCWTRRPLSALGFDIPIGMSGLGALIAVAIVLVAGAIQLQRLDARLTPRRTEALRKQLREVKVLPRTGGEFRIYLLVAVTAGVWEELLYRGFLIWYASPLLGLYGAGALSVAVFGIGHIYQGWRRVAAPTLLGLAFTIGYLATQSLWWVMAAHALVDLYGGIVARHISRTPAPAPTQQLQAS